MTLQNSMPSSDDVSAHPAISQLLASPVSTHAVQQFIAENRFPLVEPGAVTFVWLGHADSVSLLRWIHGGVDRLELTRLPDTSLWFLKLPVKDNGRFEYKLCTLINGEEHWIHDPLNPARAGDPYGENSVCKTFGYERPQWTRPLGAPEGQIKALPVESLVFQETRHESVYLPAGYDPNKIYPLVIIHDGSDFVTYAHLSDSLDNLIASGTVAPMVVALVQTRDRLGEYARGRRHARYLVNDLMPMLEQQFSLSQRAEDRILLGASLGAVASLSTVFRYPGVFGGSCCIQDHSFLTSASFRVEHIPCSDESPAW